MKRLASCLLALTMLCTGFCADIGVENGELLGNISAQATVSYTAPNIITGVRYGDKLMIKVKNASDYSSDVKLKVYFNGTYQKTVRQTSLVKDGGYIHVNQDGKLYFTPNTTYSIKIIALYSDGTQKGKSINAYTANDTYWTVNAGAVMYTKNSSNKFVSPTTVTKKAVYRGVLCTSTGMAISGQSKNNSAVYVRIIVPVKTKKNANN